MNQRERQRDLYRRERYKTVRGKNERGAAYLAYALFLVILIFAAYSLCDLEFTNWKSGGTRIAPPVDKNK